MKGNMKKEMDGIMRLLCAAAMIILISCTTTKTTVSTDASGNSVTNVVKVFDQVKTDQVKAVLQGAITDGLYRVLKNSPQHSDAIANYVREGGKVFCKMQAEGKFDPLYLNDGLDKVAIPLLPDKERDIVVVVKTTAVSLYQIFYAQRFQAELSPEKFTYNLADLFCNSIDQGLKAGGKPGIR